MAWLQKMNIYIYIYRAISNANPFPKELALVQINRQKKYILQKKNSSRSSRSNMLYKLPIIQMQNIENGKSTAAHY